MITLNFSSRQFSRRRCTRSQLRYHLVRLGSSDGRRRARMVPLDVRFQARQHVSLVIAVPTQTVPRPVFLVSAIVVPNSIISKDLSGSSASPGRTSPFLLAISGFAIPHLIRNFNNNCC